MITTNGTRLYYHDLSIDGFVCFCTLHHAIQAVTGDRDAADYYLQHGYQRFTIKYKIETMDGSFRIGSRTNVTRQIYQQWFNKVKSKFGQNVYVY